MSRKIASAVVCLLLCMVIIAASPSGAEPNQTRAVSLKALANAMRSGKSTEEAKSLCGITRLCGYLPDAQSDDVVLLGVVDRDLPPLRLDDFVVALRNIWGRYDKISGRVRYYSYPGCSIDPNPAVLGQLRDFEASQPRAASPEAMKSRMEAWKEIGKQPQKVRVLGVPFDSRFAKVMVDADYYMKRLVNGSVALDIDGLVSLSDLDIETRRQAVRAGKKSLDEGSMSRFWFSPGDATYEVRDEATILRTCPVKLMTEEERLNEDGAITQMGRPDACADRFARSFSEKYDQIAAKRPIYKELKALFSFVAIARLMKDDRLHVTAGKTLDYFLTSYKVPVTPVSRAVNGLTDVRMIGETIDTPDGQSYFGLIHSSCGGVSMDVKPRRVKTSTPVRYTTASPAAPPHPPATPSSAAARPPAVVKSAPSIRPQVPAKAPRAKTAQAKTIKQAVLGSRKSVSDMSWDVPVQLD